MTRVDFGCEYRDSVTGFTGADRTGQARVASQVSDTIQTRLAQPFHADMLRSVSKGGTSLTYVPAPEVIARLNDVLGIENWSYEVLDRWSAGERSTDSGVFPTACMAHVRLTVRSEDGVESHKDGMGGQQVKFMQNNAGPVDIGDEWKGAVSDALKKAAQAFGVGLDLARKEEALRASQAENESQQAEEAAHELGWRNVSDRDTTFAQLRAETLQLPDDEAKSVQAAVKKAGFTKFTFTAEHAVWWREVLDRATPDHPVGDRGRPADDGGATPTAASAPQSTDQQELVAP